MAEDKVQDSATAETSDWSGPVGEFLAYVSSERALAVNTRLAYERDLHAFGLFCRRRGLAGYPTTLKEIRDYLVELRRQELSPRSIARKVSAIRQFYRFLMREGKLAADPTELLVVRLSGRRLPKHLSVKEMYRLIAAAAGQTDAEVRDRALLEAWYATGARVSELASLEARHIDWEKRMAKLRGKGARERWVPLSHDAIAWCERYRVIRHRWLIAHDLKETEVFFLSSRGEKLTRQAIWKIVKKYARQAGIAKNVWPHMIRHSFATHVLRAGADLRVVQEMLGHKSISTTEVYTHLDIESLRTMQTKFHPRG